MKKIVTLAISIMLFFNACKQKENTQTQQTETIPEKPTISATTAAITTFDINKIPVSNKEIGTFPYLSSPEGYEYKYQKSKNYEEKYFCFNDSLVTKIRGKYFFSTIWKKANNRTEYEKSFVLNSYENAIKDLGGVQVYEGLYNEKAEALISKENPTYFEDLKNDLSRKNKQFVLKTPNGIIWFELNIHDRDNEIFFTVIQEEGFKQTISMLKAAEIKAQIEKTGKAVLYINFDTDKSSIKSDGLTAIKEIATMLENDKKLNLSIEGHTDNTGNLNHNKSLSIDRANEVLKTLLEMKIETSRLKATGYGCIFRRN